MIVFMSAGLPVELDAMLGGLSVWIHLYRVDIELTEATTLSQLIELDVPGYAPQPAVNWAPSSLIDGVARSEADPVLFTRTAGSPSRDVWGYYATNGVAGELLWAERGTLAPFPMHDAADELLVIPRAELGPCQPGKRVRFIDAVGDLVVTVRGRRSVAIDAVGDLVVTAAPPPLTPAIDGVGDLVVTARLDLGTREIDGAGDLVVTVEPPPPAPGIDGVGDLVVTVRLDLGTREIDGAGDLVIS